MPKEYASNSCQWILLQSRCNLQKRLNRGVDIKKCKWHKIYSYYYIIIMSLKAVIPMATITMFVCLTEGGISRRSNTNKHRCLFVPFQSPLKHIFRVNLNVNMWKLSVVCLMLHRTPYPHHGQLSILVTKQQHVIKNTVNNRFFICTYTSRYR